MLFNRKPKQASAASENPAANDSPAVAIGDDFVIHNMPRPQRGRVSSERQVSVSLGNSSAAAPRSNFKMIGLVILVVGVVVIGVLVYLSYRFLIQPAANTSTGAQVAPVVKQETEKAKETAEIVETGSPVVVAPVAPAVSTIAPATGSSTTTALAGIDSVIGQGASIEPVMINNSSALPPVLDSDSDGLTDVEEAIFGTNPTASDSNNNSYSDLTEIHNNYNPAASGRLETNANLAVYKNAAFGYELLYPKSWPAKVLTEEATAVFTATDESLVQISVQDNSDQVGILGWYGSSFPGATVTYDKMKSAASWDGIMSDDGFNFYLTDKSHKNIFVISYIPSADNRIAYPNIFQLLISSLVIK